MKLVTLTVALLFNIAGIAVAGEIIATAEVVDGNTIITCTPTEAGNIDKAYITVYENGSGMSERTSMEISLDNKAIYLLQGKHKKVEGKCRIFMLKRSGVNTMPSREEADSGVLMGKFSLNVN